MNFYVYKMLQRNIIGNVKVIFVNMPISNQATRIVIKVLWKAQRLMSEDTNQ